MNNRILKAALRYHEMGFSVIPVNPKTKRASLESWKPYQKKRADADQIREWFGSGTKTGLAIITGKVSGVTVVDVDSKKGRDALSEFLPDSLLTPHAKTPHGEHVYFQYEAGISNKVRIISDCDVRNTGGYVVAPPSRNGASQYNWFDGLNPLDVSPAPMPEMLADILRGAEVTSSREHLSNKVYERSLYIRGDVVGDNKRQHLTTNDNIGFSEGCRDNAIFHLAHCCIKGGMDPVNTEKYLKIIASNCTPPYPEKDIPTKIQSALNRQKDRGRNLTQEIRDIIVTTSGNITTTFVYNRQQVTTREEKKKVAVILSRLEKEGLLEKTGRFAGEYRILEKTCESEDWQAADSRSVDIWLPFDLDMMIEIPPGSLILVAGSQDAGKTAVFMNIARENMDAWNVHYFSSELNRAAFRGRVEKFPDMSADQWDMKFYSRSENFQDVIKTGPRDLNLIDYMEIHTEFYRVSEYLAAIHKKLGEGICIVAIQKGPFSKDGRGGSFTQEKPILSLSLDYGRATIRKFKGEFKGENPRGKEYDFKIVNGCQLIRVQDWHVPPRE